MMFWSVSLLVNNDELLFDKYPKLFLMHGSRVWIQECIMRYTHLYPATTTDPLLTLTGQSRLLLNTDALSYRYCTAACCNHAQRFFSNKCQDHDTDLKKLWEIWGFKQVADNKKKKTVTEETLPQHAVHVLFIWVEGFSCGNVEIGKETSAHDPSVAPVFWKLGLELKPNGTF